MLCLDTNILLRCITMDDAVQSPKAIAFLRASIKKGLDIYVPDVVVMETVWALFRQYRYTDGEIRAAVEPLILDKGIRFDHAQRLHSALSLMEANQISIVDAYLAAAVQASPGAKAATFDKQLQKLPQLQIQAL